MRQLLVVAIETEDALDIDHLALLVPRLIQDARGLGTLFNEPFHPREIAAAAKDLCARLPIEQNVSVHPEMSRAEHVMLGLRQLAEMIPTLSDFDWTMRDLNKRTAA